jgi:hypothetical protein
MTTAESREQLLHTGESQKHFARLQHHGNITSRHSLKKDTSDPFLALSSNIQSAESGSPNPEEGNNDSILTKVRQPTLIYLRIFRTNYLNLTTFISKAYSDTSNRHIIHPISLPRRFPKPVIPSCGTSIFIGQHLFFNRMVF